MEQKVTMLSNSDLTPILNAWQSDLHFAVEAGIAPQIPLGSSLSPLTALPGLELLGNLAAQRTDMTTPTVLAGGTSASWLAALYTVSAASANRRSPAPVLLYSGADAATHMATAGTLLLHPARLRSTSDRALPAGYRDHVAPSLQPAAPITWENLSLRILEPAGTPTGLPAASLWLGWLAAALASIMILGALIT